MAAQGKFVVSPNVLSDNSVVFDVVFMAEWVSVAVFSALDQTDAQMRCERLNAAIVEGWIDCDECGGSEKSGHMPSCSKHRNATLRRG